MNGRLRNVLAKCLTATMMFATTLGGQCSNVQAIEGEKTPYNTISKKQKNKLLDQLLSKIDGKTKKSKVLKNIEGGENPEKVVRVLVELEQKSALQMEKNNKKPTLRALKTVKLSQKTVKEKAKKLEGAELRHTYTNVLNGFSMDVKKKEIGKIQKMPGVKRVKIARVYYKAMNNATKLTQAQKTWENYSLKGQGMVVSVVDGGVAYNHKDFKEPDVKNKKLSKEGIEKIKKDGALKADTSASTYFTEKVPFGYNYADRSNQIIDTKSEDSHGAHVAGIMAADGDEEEVKNDLAIKGVAPKAQVLAMKVFTNNPNIRGAYSDDIVAAIDDSVALGADVINLSLGSDAGFQDEEDPEEIAIKNAAENGVMVVAAAGNAYYSTYPLLLPNKNDLATTDSPGVAKDAFMVSNYENTVMRALVAGFKFPDGKSEEFKMSTHQVSSEKMHGLELVDCGMGKNTDFEGKDVESKVAFIKRGDNTFVEKILNAQSNNAAGVVIYNSKNGDDELINMATDPEINIPAVFVTQTSGEKILEQLKKGKVTIDTKKGFRDFDNPHKDGYSESTSWGPSPNLDFKPQIAGPGGNIYSTINNNKYGVMTGTSMASPHVAGGMTLIMQSLKDKGFNKRELIEHAKIKAMNTASVKMSKEQDFKVPYSPRRQGAGLIQIEGAIKTNVTATYKGEAAVALKQIRDKKATFTVDLKNSGHKDIAYDIGLISGVLTQEEKKDSYNGQVMLRDRILPKEDANVTHVDKVTIPANGSKTVEFTLNVGDKLPTEKFLEGYIQFKSKDENTPNINIPFMGFYGDWGKEAVVSNNIWDKNKSEVVGVGFEGILENLALCLDGKYNDKLGILGDNNDTDDIEGKHIAINPNNDITLRKRNIFPAIFTLRNIKNINTEIVNDKNQVIRKLGSNKNIRRNILELSQNNIPNLLENLIWDAKSYNKKSGSYENVPEGQYYYRMHMKVDVPNASEQVVDMPIKVDYTEPEVKITKAEKIKDGEYKVYFVASDNLSEVNSSDLIGIFVNDELDIDATLLSPLVKEGVGEFGKDLYSKVIKKLPENQFNRIDILMFDYAGNAGVATRNINCGVAPIKFNLENPEFKSSNQINTMKDKFTFKGKISRKPNLFTIGGKDVKLTAIDEKDSSKGYGFAHEVDVKEGLNTFNVKVEDFDDISIWDYGYKIFKDTTAPEITFPDGNVDKDNVIHINNRSREIKCNVKDNAFDFEFRVNGIMIKEIQNALDDKYGEKKKEFVITEEMLGTKMENDDIITFTAKDLLGNESSIKLKLAIEETPLEVKITNIENNKIYNTNVIPKIEVNDDTAKIQATLNNNKFNMGDTISKDGKYELNIKVITENGEEREFKFNFQIDKTYPQIKAKNLEDGKEYEVKLLPEFEIEEGAVVTYTLDGNVWDGKTIIDKLGTHTLVVKATDKAGNVSEKKFEFKIVEQKEKPEKEEPSKEDTNKENPSKEETGKKDTGKDNNTTKPKDSDPKEILKDTKATTSKIPQTGSPITIVGTLSIGGAVVLSGIAIRKRNKKK